MYNLHALTLCLLVLSADNLCKQFGPRPGTKLFDTLMVAFHKELCKKVNLVILKKKKNKQMKINNTNLTSMQGPV